jgi:peptide/nickel transport system permease protein
VATATPTNGAPAAGWIGASSRKAGRGALTFWRVLRANPLTLVGFILVVLIALAALIVVVAPHLLTPYGNNDPTTDYAAAPSWAHPFGTDSGGLDIWAEVLYALPLDLGIAFAIAGVALLAGGGLGLIAGYWDKPGTAGGWVSIVILRITDIFLSFPSLILALAIAVSLGRGIWQLIVAVLLTWWPYYVRLVRGETLAVKHLPYVTAARAAGVTDGRIVLRHIVRNVLEPVIVYFTLDIGTVLVTLSTIGFVGLGLNYPYTPEWGSMMSTYQNAGLITAYPWTILGPGLAIFVTVLAFSLLGDGLRDILDPRSRRVLAGTGTGGPTSTSPEAKQEAAEEAVAEEPDISREMPGVPTAGGVSGP